MKNSIKRGALIALANAPKTAAKSYIDTLTEADDKSAAQALFKALNIDITTTTDTPAKEDTRKC